MNDETNALLRAVLAGQRELADEVRALRATAERLSRGARPTDELAARLLPIAALVGTNTFSVNECTRLARTPDGEAMRHAINRAVGERGDQGKRLGNFLKSIVGKDIEGYRVELIGDDGHGNILRIVRTSGL